MCLVEMAPSLPLRQWPLLILLLLVACARTSGAEAQQAARLDNSSPVHERETTPPGHIPVVKSRARVSPPGVGPHYWLTASSGTDPNLMIVSAIRNSADTAQLMMGVLYGSEDGGLTWRTLREERSRPFVSEVTSAFGAGRTVYFLAAGNTTLDIRQVRGVSTAIWPLPFGATILARSDDFGATWESMPSAQNYTDAPSLLVIPMPDQRSERLVVFSHGRRGDSVEPEIGISDDRGASFKGGFAPLPSTYARQHSALNFDAVRLRDGGYGAIYNTFSGGELKALSFLRTDGEGNPIGNPVIVADSPLAGAAPSFGAGSGNVARGILPSTNVERLYVTWIQFWKGRLRVALASSDDEGSSWSEFRIVDDLDRRQGTKQHVSPSRPSVAVTRSGVVGLMWVEADGQSTRFSASFDGGMRFEDSIELSTARSGATASRASLSERLYMSDLSRRGTSTLRMSISDWSQDGYPQSQFRRMLSTVGDSDFLASWVGYNGAVYAATVGFEHMAPPGRHRALDAAEKLSSTDGIFLDYTTLHYDEAAEEFRIGAVVGRAVKRGAFSSWPLTLRVRKLVFKYGAIDIVGADNDQKGVGAEWIFDGPAQFLPNKGAAAINWSLVGSEVEYSKPRTLRFKAHDFPADAFVPSDRTIIDIEYDVLTSPAEPAAKISSSR